MFLNNLRCYEKHIYKQKGMKRIEDKKLKNEMKLKTKEIKNKRN
jgi:hypothetical protein